MTKKIALIDGYGFVFRAYHSLPPLTRQDGTPVGAVYGFTNMLIKLLAGLDVSHVAVVFDSGSKTFRNDIFADYKANRPPCPEDLKPQFPIVREAAESLSLPILEKIGFEADDVIATITKKAVEKGYEVLVVSSDKDLMQLVSSHVFMYDAMKNKFIGRDEVREKFAVEPEQVVDVLALMGDSSDNVAGVRGIGPKTAAELITEYGSLEELLENLDSIKQAKRQQLLIEGKDSAILSKKLVSLAYDVDLGVEIDDLEIRQFDPHKLISFLEQQGFNSLITRVRKEFKLSEEIKSSDEIRHPELLQQISFDSVKKTRVTSAEMLKEIHQNAQKNGSIFIDLSENFVTLSTNESEILLVEIEDHKVDLFATKQADKFDLKIFEEITNDQSIKKIFFDAKDFMRRSDLEIKAFEDISLINHLLNSSIKNDFRELVDFNLSQNFEENQFTGADLAYFRNYAVRQLFNILSPKIAEQKLTNSYLSLELPLLSVLTQIERNGIKIDGEKLAILSKEFGSKIDDLTREIHTIAGFEFNIASPKQLGEVLFEKLGIESKKKSKKTGAMSTGAEVLEDLVEDGYEIAGKILEFRKFSKLKNTYTDALVKEMNLRDRRIHTTLSSISTITGRLSSIKPNLQNIPIKTAEGKKIREAFIAPLGHMLISADYSQIELRVIAHIAKIDSLVQAFSEDKDIHRITASQVFGVAEENVDDSLRSKAKAINFGIIYGISPFGLAKQLGIHQKEAADYIKSYFTAYPGIEEYMQNQINSARQNGFVTTLSGRKCFIREINNKNPIIRQEAERLAINAPIQGSAADIIKRAMILVSKELAKNNLKSKIVLQIHDELLVESPKNEIEQVCQILREQMESAIKLNVKISADIKVGEYWI